MNFAGTLQLLQLTAINIAKQHKPTLWIICVYQEIVDLFSLTSFSASIFKSLTKQVTTITSITIYWKSKFQFVMLAASRQSLSPLRKINNKFLGQQARAAFHL